MPEAPMLAPMLAVIQGELIDPMAEDLQRAIAASLSIEHEEEDEPPVVVQAAAVAAPTATFVNMRCRCCCRCLIVVGICSALVGFGFWVFD